MEKTFKTKVDMTVPAQGAEFEMQTAAQKLADNAAENMKALAALVETVNQAINDLPRLIEAQRIVESGLQNQLEVVSRTVLEQTSKIKKSVTNNIPRTPIMKMKNAIAPTKLKEAEEIGVASGEIIKAVTTDLKAKNTDALKQTFTSELQAIELKLHNAVNKAQEQLRKTGFKK